MRVHSVPVHGDASACAPRVAAAHPALRGLVAGYAGFGGPAPGRSRTGSSRWPPPRSSSTWRALVTGGSRGIGRAIVRRLASLGARVVYTYRRDAFDFDLPDVTAVRADQADPGALAAMFAPVRASGLDILVNNAAIAPRIPLAKLTGEDFDRVMAINTRFPLLAIREAATLMRDHGRIVNLSTLNTVVAGPGLALYCASKAALEQITAVAARELGPRGITVNTVSPGQTDTDMLRATAPWPDIESAAASFGALGRVGTPDDVAAVVAWLAGPDAAWITGQNIRATGGLIV
ncbi:3-oxoacyl-[acyl-carrier protein] reductase [Catenuloplanes nepalensis]|uniref:3-oxoacyl-[acyl-carrier protein] reductase n=1 Tax=Catenuloplanes nepalensis TaxID=587533 RepID=A0ABT9MTF6_9ACTN|nr:SDR family oxidoreductase [Catenuloplanes nepalensis]MDP9794553.1 3-oxoacyl-[acyl-carrier protein] reductase [Catenuloplanes nepalensis]